MPNIFGTWKLKEPVGRGAQSRVFRAVRIGSDSDSEVFAIKRLSRTGNVKARSRFAREIDALKRISHRGIVSPIDHSQPDDPNPYYVMPYEEDVKPLSELIWPTNGESVYKHKPLMCLDLIAHCAEALATAHQANVVHRDLKPDNILVRLDGTPLIIDFGCCVVLDGEGALTLTDEGVGARNFMSPECEAGMGEKSSPRSDVYSLGKILWCMISGERPFARERPGFSNKLVTALMPDDPYVGFIVEAMLLSVRENPSHRSETAMEFAEFCKGLARRIRSGARHVSYVAPRCPVCHSTNVQASNGTIERPLKLDVFVFTGNKENNPHLYAKFCFDCGSVMLHDTRPQDKYDNLVSQAT